MVSAGPSPEGVGPVPRQECGGRRLSWLVLLLTLAAVTSSSLSALSLFHMLALRVEMEGLRSEVFRRREVQQEARHEETLQQMNSSSRTRRSSLDPPRTLDPQPPPRPPDTHTLLSFIRKRSVGTGPDNTVSQPCLQMLADSSRKTFLKEFALEPHTGIPWQEGLRRGSALEVESDSILVREEGYYFVYSQVYYMDRTFAMGHVVNKKKRNVVRNEAQHVTLFRCIQNMNPVYPYNTCYTGGIVKLEVGDSVELLIPRFKDNISLDGDSTFLGAFRLL